MTAPVAEDTDPFDVRSAAALAPPPCGPSTTRACWPPPTSTCATRLAALAGETDGEVALAAALAVRGPRLGHVYVDLATVRETTVVDVEEPVDLAALPWPDAGAWVVALAASPLVASGEADDAARCPLRLVGTRLYLDRYWREERQIAAELLAFAAPATRPTCATTCSPTGSRGCSAPATRASGSPPHPPCCGGSRSSRAARAPARPTTVARIVALLGEQSAARWRCAAAGRAGGADRQGRRPPRRGGQGRGRGARRPGRGAGGAARPGGLDAAPAARVAPRQPQPLPPPPRQPAPPRRGHRRRDLDGRRCR